MKVKDSDDGDSLGVKSSVNSPRMTTREFNIHVAGCEVCRNLLEFIKLHRQYKEK